MYLLIDESGRLSDPREQVFIVSGVLVKSLRDAERIVKKIRAKIPKKGFRRHERYAELKFSYSGKITRHTLLREMSELSPKVFVMYYPIKNRFIRDTVENYARFIVELLTFVAETDTYKIVYIDKRYTNKRQLNQLQKIISSRISSDIAIIYADSLSHQCMSLPDCIAGSVRESICRKDDSYLRSFEGMIHKKSGILQESP